MIALLISAMPALAGIGATLLLTMGRPAHRRRLLLGSLCLVAAFVIHQWLDGWQHKPWANQTFLQMMSVLPGLPAAWADLKVALPLLANVAALVAAAAFWLVLLPWRGPTRSWFEAYGGRSLRRFAWFALAGVWFVVLVSAYVRPIWFASVDLNGVYWFVPLVVSALLVGAPRKIGVDRESGTEVKQGEAHAEGDIKALLAHFQKHYSSHILVDPRPAEPPGEIQAADSNDDLVAGMLRRLDLPGEKARRDARSGLAQCFDNFWNVREPQSGAPAFQPWNVLVDSELTSGHLAVVGELIQSCHDQGGVVLVIAPSWTLGRVKRALEADGERTWSDITQRTWDLTERPFDRSALVNVLFATVDTLEDRFLATISEMKRGYELNALTGGQAVVQQQEWARHDRFLSLLRLVVVLDFQQIEPAMLRFRLHRLKRLTEQQEIRVLCQSEARESLEAIVDQTFGTLGSHARRNLRLPIRAADRQRVVWRNDHEALLSLRQVEGKLKGPIEIAPYVARIARRMGVEPAFIDDAGRWDSDVWAESLGKGTAELIGSFPRKGAGCIVIEDRANLVDALGHERNFAGRDRYVLVVVSHRYALREWFIHLFATRQETEDLRPVTPDPKGGLTEIATVLAAEFRSSAGRSATVQELAKLLKDLDASVVRTFGLFPTPGGIDRLFAAVRNGRGLRVTAEEQAPHEIRLKLSPAETPPSPPRLTIGVTGAGAAAFHLAPGDNGLRFARDTSLHGNGMPYQVSHADDARIEVVRARNPGLTRWRYLFHRQYRLGETIAVEGDPHWSRRLQVNQHRAVLRGEVERLTPAQMATYETEEPIRGNSVAWDRADILVRRSHAAMLIWRIELPRTSGLFTVQTRPAIAFTLAATLQDVIGSFFPNNNHRLAVVSPHAGPAIAEMIADRADDERFPADCCERFPADFYPRLVDSVRQNNDLQTPPGDVEAAEDKITDLLQSAKLRVAAPGTALLLDIVVIEDADYDMGVVNVLRDPNTWKKVFENAWSPFLYWLGGNPDENAGYYRFGASKLPSCFEFGLASNLLDQTRP